MICWGYTNTVGASPTVFSGTENPFLDAQKIGSAFEKGILSSQTVALIREIIAWIVQTMFMVTRNILSGTSTTV
jgi:hypothetical protein